MLKNKSLDIADWQSELNASAYRYHSSISLVAALLNPFWAISDYFTNPNHIVDFLSVRIVVSIITLLFVFFKRKFITRPEMIAFIPFILFSSLFFPVL